MNEEMKQRYKELQQDSVVLLLDGDIYAYRAAAATDGRTYMVLNQEYKYKKDAKMASAEADNAEIELVYNVEPESHAYHLLKTNIKKLDNEFSNNSFVLEVLRKEVFLTNGGSFREKEVNKNYKQNREGMRRPHHLAGCKQWMTNNMGAQCEQGEYEADDLLIIRAEELKALGVTPIIVSIDKDLKQWEGWHYNFVKGELEYVSSDSALRNFYTQLLTGDSTDGIVGLKGVGPKTAEKILKPYTTSFEMYKAVLGEWIKRGKREPEETQEEYYTRKIAEVRMTARLLYLLRKRGEHWNAPVADTKAEES